MKKAFGGKRSYAGGGGSGGRSSYKGGFANRGGDRKELHEATCSTCGNTCKVPFRPNGRAPVYCRECFKGGDSKPSYGGEKRSFRDERSHDRPRTDNSTAKIEARLDSIEDKLDALIEALSEMGEEEA